MPLPSRPRGVIMHKLRGARDAEAHLSTAIMKLREARGSANQRSFEAFCTLQITALEKSVTTLRDHIDSLASQLRAAR